MRGDFVNNFVPNLLLELLSISMVFSIILMALVQKLKSFKCITKSCHVMIMNVCLAFMLGIPFCITFYDIKWSHGCWVALFSFIGASAIYTALKKQNLINYNPTSIDDNISISKNNEIKR